MISKATWDRLHNKIIKFFQTHPSGEFTRKELMEYLNIGWHDYDPMHKILSDLTNRGILYRTRQDHGHEASVLMPTYYYRLVHQLPNSKGQTAAIMVANYRYRSIKQPNSISSSDNGIREFSNNKVPPPENFKGGHYKFVRSNGKDYPYYQHYLTDCIQVSLLGDRTHIPEVSFGEAVSRIKDVYLCYVTHPNTKCICLMIVNIASQLDEKKPRKTAVKALVQRIISKCNALYYYKF